MTMSNNGKKRTYRERRDRETRETISERVPKKNRGGSDNNGDADQQEDGVVREADLLDPVAEARKALEKFEEVSGETILQIIPKKDTTMKAETGQKYNEHVYLNSQGDSGQISRTKKKANGSTNKKNHEEKLDGIKNSSPNTERRKEQARQKEDEEERARQRKRIEDGEARRREFRPKIAGLQDSNCLL